MRHKNLKLWWWKKKKKSVESVDVGVMKTRWRADWKILIEKTSIIWIWSLIRVMSTKTKNKINKYTELQCTQKQKRIVSIINNSHHKSTFFPIIVRILHPAPANAPVPPIHPVLCFPWLLLPFLNSHSVILAIYLSVIDSTSDVTSWGAFLVFHKSVEDHPCFGVLRDVSEKDMNSWYGMKCSKKSFEYNNTGNIKRITNSM